ncbi:ribosomal protein S30-domain-containing protein [Lentinula detonsa]|uniref:40S ribosomal protein S30 n=1 Tax=Lentinula detonsa TaxID=2804962 RepID=A0AA38PUA3_9AGAR|nr:ribosomal protein S30-domain-containing protein [Lentinula detonsa]
MGKGQQSCFYVYLPQFTSLLYLVHGSLARAGKVKSQTPKVEAQEKKKTPKGRAKKRILYNRRFVNVTTLPGGKRRM